ncbi:MAG TPA: ABC transporter permease [Blastocatellia bacterium]|nr:ABC transporter permease [Blastocatellia bacterium]
METLLQDLRYGFRMLIQKPAFTFIIVIALAIGIGATTAIFSVVNAVLLRPLSFNAPDKIMMVWNTEETEKADQFGVSYPDFIDWRERNQSFEQLAAYSTRDFTMTGAGEPVRLRGAMVTDDLFPILGVAPRLGRFFLSEEDKPGARAAILSHRMWQQHFASDPQVCDKAITLNGQSYTVVGVMPAGFQFPVQNDPVIDFWMTTAILQEGAVPLTVQRGNHALEVIGRLKEGATLEQAQADMSAIAGTLGSQYPDTNSQLGARVAPLQTELVRDVRPALLILFGAVGCVLLIACVNVANLLLVRATTRQKEIAIRTALGATRLRVIRQLLTESLVLSFVGGVLGLLLAMWGMDLLIALAPGLPRAGEITIDAKVLGFTALIALATGIFFGIAPALQVSRTELTQTLKEGGRTSGAGAHHNSVRSMLIVFEIAIALMLLVGAGLFINSFLRLQRVNPGFDTNNALSFRIGLPDVRYPEAQQKIAFYKQLASRIESLPGVKNVAYTTALPLSGQRGSVGFSIEGEPSIAGRPFPYDADYRTVSPGYFNAMGIPLVNGRDFDERDEMMGNPVVIINEMLAKRYFANQNPLGKRINPSFGIDNRGILMREIVGVVGNLKHSSLSAETQPEVYIAYKQNPRPTMMFVIRASNDPNSLVTAIREETRSLDSLLPIYNVKTFDQYLSASVAQPRFNTLLLGVFAGVALILTIVGLYGVTSYSVTQRSHEIGVRMALGATSRDVLALVIKQGMRLTLTGVALGLVGAFALTRVAESLLFGVTATDPFTFIAVSALLIGVSIAACAVPARRATKVDPMIALRYE